MAKKNFKESNPALAFINTGEEDPEEKTTKTTKRATTSKEKTPEGYKPNPEYIELKTRRVQFLLQPTVVETLKEVAHEKHTSMNDIVDNLIKEYLEKEGRL